MDEKTKQYLANGGTLTNGQIPTKYAPTGGEITTIPLDSLSTPTPKMPDISSVTNPNANYFGTINNSLSATTPVTDTSTELVKKISGLMGETTNKEAYTQEQKQLFGQTELEAKQKQLQAEATALQNESKALQNETLAGGSIENKLQQRFAGTGATRGETSVDKTMALRENQIKQADLASRSLLLESQYAINKGELDIATQKVNDAVNARYSPIEKEIDNNTKLLQLYAPFMTIEQNKIANEKQQANEQKKTELADKKKQQTDVINFAQTNGDSNTASKALQLDPNSSTFTQDLAKLQGQVKVDQTDKVYKQLQIQKLQQDIENNGVNSNDASTLIAYAQQYASTGQIPTGLPKGTFGTVSALAKELPKTTGEIVDNNTGIKPNKLSSSQLEGLAALRDLTIKLDQAKTQFSSLNTGLIGGTFGNVFPSKERQDYNIVKNEIVDLLSRARSGAALTESEIKTYTDKLPGTFNKTFCAGTSGQNLLDGLKKSISDKLDTTLKANGASMYGFSEVNLGGQNYKVGDIININGLQGRVNPDGTITTIN